MTNPHYPITPPPELVQQWQTEWCNTDESGTFSAHLATRAAQWGADQELEACLDQLSRWGIEGTENLRNTRRPKPPSLKQQALDQLAFMEDRYGHLNTDYIRRALEQLND